MLSVMYSGAVLGFCCLAPSVSHADYKDDAVLAARDAFRAGDGAKFERYAAMAGEGHIMQPYLEVWRFKLSLSDKKAPWPDGTVNAILDRNSPSLAAEQLRREWLLQLAKREDWAQFKIQWNKLVTRDDPGLQCLQLASDLADSKDVMANARPMLLSPKELPEACVLLGERLLNAGKLSIDDLMIRVRVLVEANQKSTARKVYDYMVDKDPAHARTIDGQFDNAYDKPSIFLSRLSARPSTAMQELAAIAVARIARDTPDEGARWITEQLDNKLSDSIKSWAWSEVALNAARKWHPKTLEWYGKTTADSRSDEANEWYVRAALLAKNWPTVQRVIEAMPVAQRGDATWTYWLGRAKESQGDVEGARKQYLQAANPFTFYGKLSLEELGIPTKLPPPALPVTQAELKAAGATPGFQRALVWYQLGQRTEGFREFNFTLTGLKDRQLLAASEWAKRNELYDRAIAAADRTVGEHEPALRYLTPYRDVMQAQSAQTGVDETWAYGLIRQESRFVTVARSGVGASGLMQLMPATAQLVAKKIGMADFTKDKVNDINVNLQLGMSYLRMMMDQLDNSLVLASAGYNAGPNRPKAWMTRLPLGQTVEGAIFAEAIPFNETRDYVKKVLSNATLYAALLEGKPQSLKARLGIITGRGGLSSASVETNE